MRKDNIIFCDSPACEEPDRIIHPTDPGLLNYGKVDYHCGCYVDYLRKHNAIVPKSVEARAS